MHGWETRILLKYYLERGVSKAANGQHGGTGSVWPSGPVSKRRSLGSVRPRFGVFGPTIHEESRQAVSAKPERYYSFFTSSSSPSSRRAAFVSSTR